MSLYSSITHQSFLLRQTGNTWSIAVFVIRRKEVVNLSLIAVLLAQFFHLMNEVKMIDALQRLSVHIILFLGAFKLVDCQNLYLGCLKIQELILIVTLQLWLLCNRYLCYFWLCHQIHCHCVHCCISYFLIR